MPVHRSMAVKVEIRLQIQAVDDLTPTVVVETRHGERLLTPDEARAWLGYLPTETADVITAGLNLDHT